MSSNVDSTNNVEFGFRRIIHQTYKSFDTIPNHWKHVPASWQRHHPTWEYKFWSDTEIYDFVKTYYSQHYEFFVKLPYHIQRVDMVRYFLLHHYGGVYSDLDIEALAPLDSLFKIQNEFGQIYLIRSPNGRYFTNMFMASSKPGHPFWLQVIEEIKDRVENGKRGLDKHLTVLNTTGPGMLDDLVSKTEHSVLLLPSVFLYPKECGMSNNDDFCSTDKSLVRHLKGSSWVSPSAQFISKIYSSKYFPIYCLLLLLVVILFLGSIGFVLGQRFAKLGGRLGNDLYLDQDQDVGKT